ncbi:glycosyltransferase-like domain-containing protein 1 [Galendromus occidentalis]|uniref:tRNA-queuosine alpha-mannosyltransferase n=1 Tax=Galendromus occidentalis TaxID=34638 RepID=A0AAJ6QQB0_9ACAR|nr:glycosyltransferase-like domain-containing protein 1 [Galendromus occidentalis]
MDVAKPTTLIVEPFYGGSHAQLMELFVREFQSQTPFELISMRATKWHWRARTSALWLSQNIPRERGFKKLFITSVVNLAELLGLRRDLAEIEEKIVYFHENQLDYPVLDEKERNFQYGYNQIMTALAADRVIFNSGYNASSFLSRIDSFLNKQPDYHTQCRHLIEKKCSVLFFPINLERFNSPSGNDVLHILWPHRWEHDKDPNAFFEVLRDLKGSGCSFEVSVLGESYGEVPPVFHEARDFLEGMIRNWGYASSRDEYSNILRSSDIVVSTAIHEFYGVAVLEAVFCGAYPLVPNRLSYPELLPQQCLYSTRAQLVKRLKEFCRKPHVPRKLASEIDLAPYHWVGLKEKYRSLLF